MSNRSSASPLAPRTGPSRADLRSPSGRRSTVVVAAFLTTLVVGLGVACAPPAEPPNPWALRLSNGYGQIDLSWQVPGGGSPAVQVQWSAGSTWTTLTTTTATTATFADPVNRTRYSFRVRTAAQGGAPSGEWSPAVATTYVDLVLPVIRIDTEDAAPILDRENYVRASFRFEPNGSAYAPFTGTMGIRGRGNSTWTYPKKPYRLKLDTKASLMGMAAERDWILLANYVDRSQMRTWTAAQVSEATDLAYTNTFRHVEVVLNGRYEGVYQFTEHNEVGPDRVDITEMEDTDNSGVELTGGYRLEMDDRLEENAEPGWRTTHGVPIVVKDPDPATPEQRSYIQSFVQSFEDSVFASNYRDPVNGFRKYLDMDAWIDHYLVQELTRNQDVWWSSTFFTKERGQDKLVFGPVWDFDRSMGTIQGSVPSPPEGFRARAVGDWALRMFNDPALVQQVAQRWQELRPAFAAIAPQIQTVGTSLQPAVLNDAARWKYTVDTTDTPEFLRNWYTTRMAWLDTQYPAS